MADSRADSSSRVLAELALLGAGGEPVDLRRTLASHGVVELPPQRLAPDLSSLETTLALNGRARTVRVRAGTPGTAVIETTGRAPGARAAARIVGTIRDMLRLDLDLSAFYEAVRGDSELAWAAEGAGRMLRSPTVFEDVVKTICTTNCAWSATVRMVTALVDYLGTPAPDGRRSFPSPAAMAEASDGFYREVVRAGYRGAYLRALAELVASGAVELEALDDPELPDAEVMTRLLALPGIGPYGAAHVMQISLGRYSRLVLDSWTRPTYAKLSGARRPPNDRTIERRFRRYGEFAGLAFWLYLTKSWVPADAPSPAG